MSGNYEAMAFHKGRQCIMGKSNHPKFELTGWIAQKYRLSTFPETLALDGLCRETDESAVALALMKGLTVDLQTEMPKFLVQSINFIFNRSFRFRSVDVVLVQH